MDLGAVDAIADELDRALDSLVDSSDRWRDIPFHYFCGDDGWGNVFEMQCSFCGARFWPLFWEDRDWKHHPFYMQAGYWFGREGESHYFPICSDSCHDAIYRQLKTRMIHTKAEMMKIGRARRLVAECRKTVRRIKREQGSEGRPTIHAGRSQGNQIL